MTLCGGTLTSGGGTPDRGGGMPFRPVPAEFNHCICLYYFREVNRMESPAMLIKKFQALQEQRVHTYKAFDEYVQFQLTLSIC